MKYEPVMTADWFEAAREQTDELWSDEEVFDENRGPVPLDDIVYAIVEGTVNHPQGHNVYEVEQAVAPAVNQAVSHEGLMGESLPQELKKKLASEISPTAQLYAVEVYKQIRDNVDEEDSQEALQDRIQNAIDAAEFPAEI